jgi:putative flavoprotein involved in K+ transport
MDPIDDVLDVIVIGAGQAGLATAYHLRRRGMRFLVVDAGHEIGSAWRSRWESLRLFTPAQYDGLPGMPFPAPADTHPTKDEVADYLTAYAARFDLPILLDCAVIRLEREGDRFAVHTSQGRLSADQVVVATGPFQTPVVPGLAAGLGPHVVQLHSASYRNPADVPPGPVVVVGAGNSGRQIALELAATHDVTLAVGTQSLELPQRFLRRDLFWWLTRIGVLTKTADSVLARRMRARGDLVIGTPLRRLRAAGVTIRPRLTATGGGTVRFEDGGVDRPAAVLWATGYRSDYTWIDVPGVVHDGRIVHERGRTDVPGLYFVGLPWQHTRGSALLGFVQYDAAWITTQLTARTPQQVMRHPVP